MIPIPDDRLRGDRLLKRIIPNHKTYYRCICHGHRIIGKSGLGRTAGDHVFQPDLKAGLVSMVDQVAQVPFRTALEISREGDSPATGGNLCYSYPLSIWCYSHFPEGAKLR